MPTISRMTPEDLTAIGITKPQKRQILKTEIQKLSIADGIPSFKPSSLLEWLKILRLEEYFAILCQQGYDSIDRVTELAWEDLEEVGITKLGHQKKIMLAIKRIQNVNNNISRSQVSDTPHNLSLPLIYSNNSSCNGLTRAHNNGFQMPANTQFQDTVPITMFAPTKSSPSPTTEQPITPQLKTFQQLPNNGFMFSRQRSEAPYLAFASNDTQNPFLQSSRGRSLESLDNNESNFYQMYTKQSNAFNGFPKQTPFCGNESSIRECDQIHGYETDNEVMNSYANHRKTMYEIDGTATLNRPKGLIKAKPVAKIVAKTRQTDPNVFNHQIYDTQKNNSFDKRFDSLSQSDFSLQNNYISDDLESNTYYQDMSSQIYSSLKRKKTPPPPPKRVNSMRNTPNNSPLYGGQAMPSFSPHLVHRQNYDQFQEQVFASCVKNLTTRFSINNNSDDMRPNGGQRQPKDMVDYSNDFPPPPSPLPFNECQNYNTLQRKRDKTDRDCNISSSSSTESMPFANDNIGTIKQRVSIDYTHKDLHSPSHSYTCSAPPSMTSSPSSPTHQNVTQTISPEDISPNDSDPKVLMNILSPVRHRAIDHQRMGVKSSATASGMRANPLDPLDDIETMLVNLSNQLDLMLETDHSKRTNN
ncbi:unnamed protein product [Medioppia subpectinata]|uniref:SAM domain-containing protein n=1 Tax=Medioppia subpectinata TaxID=1979941 RepID=A0A7R9KZ35_9ACAR|nr:unnamed protein product [Medioppia subpectinata]CAG2112551.1 unnamed protein product [Medioppia subpectinata]